MAAIRNDWWIPQLRSKVKKIINKCNTCKVYRAKPYGPSTTAAMPTFRTERGKPFQQLESISPALWATRSRRRNRVNDRMLHSNVYRCATSMAVHLEMTQSQTAEEFQRKLNAFIARRTRPQLIISDNTTVFKLDPKDTKEWTAARPPSQARNKVAVQPVQIPMVGRGGMYERLIKDVKKTLYKTLGKQVLHSNNSRQ